MAPGIGRAVSFVDGQSEPAVAQRPDVEGVLVLRADRDGHGVLTAIGEGELGGIEGRRALDDRIAPAQEHERRATSKEMGDMLERIADERIRLAFWQQENERRAADYRLRGPSW